MSKWLEWAAENLSPATMVKDSEFGGDYVVYLEGAFRPCINLRLLPNDLYELSHYDSLSTTGWHVLVPSGHFDVVSNTLLLEVSGVVKQG